MPIALKFLSNEVIAKICCWLKFSAATDDEFIEELRNTSENKNTKRSTDYWTKIFQQSAKTRGKMTNLKATKYQSLTKSSIILPFMW